MYKHVRELIFIVVGVAIIAANFFILQYIFPVAFNYLNITGGIIAVVPPLWFFYSEQGKRKQMEEQFIVFVSDITESINSGMTLPVALTHCSKRDYLALTPHVKKLSVKVDWGIPFKKAIRMFAKNTGSFQIKRAVNTILEAYRTGGRVAETLTAITKSLQVIEKIKKERSASVHSQIVTLYLIYFIFVFILVILQTFLIPSFSPPQVPALPGTSTGPISEFYTSSFTNFIIIQGFFAGLVTGKMAEGSILSGFKHSLVLIAVGYTFFSLLSGFEFAFI